MARRQDWHVIPHSRVPRGAGGFLLAHASATFELLLDVPNSEQILTLPRTSFEQTPSVGREVDCAVPEYLRQAAYKLVETKAAAGAQGLEI